MKQQPKAADLAFFETERTVDRRSRMWPSIGVLQKRGLVRVRFGTSREVAFVSLTDLGRKEVGAEPVALGG